MNSMRRTKINSVYELKVTLEGTTLPVWRTVQAPSAITLHKLHSVIQAAMGWEDYHLYRFEIGNGEYGESDQYGMMTLLRDARRAWFGSEVQTGDTFTYEYDFGDSWLHRIVVKQELSPEPDMRYPVCIRGEGACPPEDCGGIYGYSELLEKLSEPTHEQHSDAVSWVGEGFDPRAFDVAKANSRLGRIT